MKRLVILTLLAVLLTGCVKQEDYDALYKENTKLEKKVERLEADNAILESEYEDLKSDYESLKQTLDNSNFPDTQVSQSNQSAASTRFFTIDDSDNDFNNSDTGENISYIAQTNGQQKPDCLIIYTLPFIENANIKDYEAKITWLVTEMDDYFAEKQFENYTIYVYTPQGIDRDVTSVMLLGTNYGVSGHNRDGSEADEPDWFIDSCVDIINNGFEDKWLIDTIEQMKSEIDNCIHYH